MTGARRLALEYIGAHLESGQAVLDLCCGDRWLRPVVQRAGGGWFGIDCEVPDELDTMRCDLAQPSDVPIPVACDLAVSAWGLQHLCNDEARAWLLLREHLKSGGRFVYVGRHSAKPTRENGRADPLNGYNLDGFTALALATGFEVLRFDRFLYDETAYNVSLSDSANAFGAVLRRMGDR